jgi:hypothetical protein
MPFYVAEFQFRYNNRMNSDIFGTAITDAEGGSRPSVGNWPCAGRAGVVAQLISAAPKPTKSTS